MASQIGFDKVTELNEVTSTVSEMNRNSAPSLHHPTNEHHTMSEPHLQSRSNMHLNSSKLHESELTNVLFNYDADMEQGLLQNL